MVIFQRFGEQRRKDRYAVREEVTVLIRPYDDLPFPVFDISMSGLSVVHQLTPDQVKAETGEMTILVDGQIAIDHIPYKIMSEVAVPEGIKRGMRYGIISLDQMMKLHQLIDITRK